MLRIFCGPAPHYRVDQSGAIAHQKSKPTHPLWRLVAVDEQAKCLWASIYQSKPRGVDVTKALDLLLNGNIDGYTPDKVTVPSSMESMFPEISAVLDLTTVPTYRAPSGFAARVHLVKAWDRYLDYLLWALSHIREGMITVDEFYAELAGESRLLRLDADGVRGDYYDLARSHAARICRARGRDPDMGNAERSRAPGAPHNTHAHGRAIPDILKNEVVKLRRYGERLTDIGKDMLSAGELLLDLRDGDGSDQEAHEVELARIVAQSLFRDAVRNPYNLSGAEYAYKRLVGHDNQDANHLERAMFRALDRPFPRRIATSNWHWPSGMITHPTDWMRLYWIEVEVFGELPEGPHLSVIPRHNRVCEAMRDAARGFGVCFGKDLEDGRSFSFTFDGVRHANWGSPYSNLAVLAIHGMRSDAPKKRWFQDGPWKNPRRSTPILVTSGDANDFGIYEQCWPTVAARASAVVNDALAREDITISVRFARLLQPTEYVGTLDETVRAILTMLSD